MNLQSFSAIKGYEDRYLVSKKGEVYSIKKQRLIKPRVTEKGYLTIELWADYKRKVLKVHRLVADTFIDNPKGLKEVNHKDGDKQNNCVSNLEWCTRSENLKHAYALGLRKPTKPVRSEQWN